MTWGGETLAKAGPPVERFLDARCAKMDTAVKHLNKASARRSLAGIVIPIYEDRPVRTNREVKR
jgi:hypothetical protein